MLAHQEEKIVIELHIRIVYLIQKMTDNMFTQVVKYNMLAQIDIPHQKSTSAFVSSFCVIIFIF